MAGKITEEFRTHVAEQFYENFSEAAQRNIYLFISKNSAWPNESSPPDVTLDVKSLNIDVWRNMLALKKITSTDVTLATKKTNWVSGTVYVPYSYTTEYFTNNNFYVLTEDYNVYKCMNNNNGAVSTIKPSGTSANIVSYADGYKWKFLFSINASDAIKFITTDYMPVKTLTVDDGSKQWLVQQAATPGSIDQVNVSNGGTLYPGLSSVATDGSSSTITLGSSASATNNYYNGCTVYITTGTGAGQLRTISGYVGATKVATVSSNFTTTPDTTSTFIVGPAISVVGDGTGFSGYTTVTSGSISSITVLNAGANYTYANMSLTAGVGSGAILIPQLPVAGGHGADPIYDLYAHNVITNTKLSGSESGGIFVSNDYRIIGLIRDPLLLNGSVATNTIYDMTTVLTITGASGTFTADEVLTGSVSGATGNLVSYRSNTTLSVVGQFVPYRVGETITGATSGKTATISVVTEPALKKFTGKALYIDNRNSITRSEDQTEEIKMIIKL